MTERIIFRNVRFSIVKFFPFVPSSTKTINVLIFLCTEKLSCVRLFCYNLKICYKYILNLMERKRKKVYLNTKQIDNQQKISYAHQNRCRVKPIENTTKTTINYSKYHSSNFSGSSFLIIRLECGRRSYEIFFSTAKSLKRLKKK